MTRRMALLAIGWLLCAASAEAQISTVGTEKLPNNCAGGSIPVKNGTTLEWDCSSAAIATSFTTATLIGGTAANSSLTLQSTSGAGTTDAIVFKVGNNGAVTAGTIATTGLWTLPFGAVLGPYTAATVPAAGSAGRQVYQSDGQRGAKSDQGAQFYFLDGDVYNVKEFGAIGDGTSHPLSERYASLGAAQAVYAFVTATTQQIDYAAIQAAINAANTAGGGTVVVPNGMFMIDTAITIYSNLTLRGNGKASLLKVAAASSFDILSQTTADIANLVIDGLGFDGSLNYPANSQVYQFGGTFPLNMAISVYRSTVDARTTNDIKNLTIRNCAFNQMSNGSIRIAALNIEDVQITGNYLYMGSYRYKAIDVRATDGRGATQLAKRITITNNKLDTNGPQIFYDASKEDYIASADGIDFDGVQDSTISNNTVHKAGAIGIRVEESLRVAVTGNTVSESGSDGIFIYISSTEISIVGNTVLNWGRTPVAYGIRDYSSTYVVAREFPLAIGPTLPADPTGSTWFQTWPYSVADVNVATIISYSNSDYYSGTSTGILPFRGNSAISITGGSTRCAVVGNTTLHSTALDGSSKFTHSSDFGFSFIHPVNTPYAGTGQDCFVGVNDFQGRVYSIYAPTYHDLINAKGLLGTAYYAARPAASIVTSATPAFLVRFATNTNNNIAVGSATTLVWSTELKDQSASFASNTFTAPTTGLYQMSVTLDLRDLDTGSTLYEANIVTSNRSYAFYLDPSKFSADVTYRTIAWSVLADMDINDTATVTITQTAGTQQTDVQSGSSWSGFLIQ